MSDTKDIIAAIVALKTAAAKADDAWDAHAKATIAKDNTYSEAMKAKSALDEIINNYAPE